MLNKIFENNQEELEKIDFLKRDLNYLASHPDTDLDDKISPLAQAAFLGRHEIVLKILENPTVNIDFSTEETGLTPLSSAWAAGHYLVVKTLVENGADVNKKTGLDYSPIYYCFTRMTESTNLFENKNICCKIAEVLLQAGADVDTKKSGKTLLMKFWGLDYSNLSPIQQKLNLDVIKFLVQHGADKHLQSNKGETSYDLANKYKNNQEVIKVLDSTGNFLPRLFF